MSSSRAELARIFLELERRNQAKKNVHELVASQCYNLFHPGQQRAFFAKDDSGKFYRRLALRTHRRWGKSQGALTYAGKACELRPYTRVAYISQHRTNAKDIAWPILMELSAMFGWRAKPNMVDLSLTWPNGSFCKLYGADQDRFAKLLRGLKFDVVIIDEAQQFEFTDLEHLCDRIVGPTLTDRRGRLFVIGTPGEIASGFYYKLTVENFRPKTWHIITSSEFENPYTAEQLMLEIEELKAENPDIIDEPWVQREYFGKWVADTRRTVIKLIPKVNYLYEWEEHPADRYYLGIDFGFEDPSAYVVAVENPEKYPYLVYLEARECRQMLLDDHIALLNEYQTRYPGIRMVSDPGGHAKALLEELRQVYGFPLEEADKKEKRFHVERLNSEATRGLIKIYNLEESARPQDNQVAVQWNSLIRVQVGNLPVALGGEWEEGRPRHIHDAALYARRAATLMEYKERTEETYAEKETRRMFEARVNRVKKRRFVR